MNDEKGKFSAEPGNGCAPAGPPSKRIAIVDDDVALVEALCELLADEGYAVETFTDPSVALDRLRTVPPPDVLLLDYRMPEMSGGEFLAALRATGVHVPTVLLTAMPTTLSEIDGLPVVRVVSKPFDLEGLLRMIAEL